MRASLNLLILAAGVLILVGLPQPLPAADADACTAVDNPLETVADLAPSGDNRIQNGPCSWTCTPSSSCDTECIDDNDNQTTCGGYGVCGGGTCTPHWVAVSETVIGVYDRQDFLNPPACEVREVVEVTWTDTNGCGNPNWTSCYERVIGYEPSGFCCGVYYSCFGPRGCAAAGY
jgi:hypothetical protein